MERFAGLAVSLVGVLCLLLGRDQRLLWLTSLPLVGGGLLLQQRSEQDRREQELRQQQDATLDLESDDVFDPTLNKPGRT